MRGTSENSSRRFKADQKKSLCSFFSLPIRRQYWSTALSASPRARLRSAVPESAVLSDAELLSRIFERALITVVPVAIAVLLLESAREAADGPTDHTTAPVTEQSFSFDDCVTYTTYFPHAFDPESQVLCCSRQ